jgi:hypothetical protein
MKTKSSGRIVAASHSRRTPRSLGTRLAELNVQYVQDQAGKRTGVLVPIKKFEQLVEDMVDLVAMAERRDEPTIPHAMLLAELQRDGLL